jgi:alpha-L-rhamnosidase
VLSRFGYTDVAYTLLMQDSYPSWLYPVKMGATTIWERWDGIKPDSTFQTPGMNSFNHYAYGAIGDWMYRVVAGVDTDEEKPGYKSIVIRPRPNEKLTEAAATLYTYYGTLKSGWKRENNMLTMDIEIPANTTATIFIPSGDPSRVTESGKPLDNRTDIQLMSKPEGNTQVKLGSGVYHFIVK